MPSPAYTAKKNKENNLKLFHTGCSALSCGAERHRNATHNIRGCEQRKQIARLASGH